jgi:hypothetical protein
VLSTPPAFVLSQDQTLQQKTVEKRPGNKHVVTKGIPPTISKKTAGRVNKILWHWLYKHPVEFSKNNHTPSTLKSISSAWDFGRPSAAALAPRTPSGSLPVIHITRLSLPLQTGSLIRLKPSPDRAPVEACASRHPPGSPRTTTGF